MPTGLQESGILTHLECHSPPPLNFMLNQFEDPFNTSMGKLAPTHRTQVQSLLHKSSQRYITNNPKWTHFELWAVSCTLSPFLHSLHSHGHPDPRSFKGVQWKNSQQVALVLITEKKDYESLQGSWTLLALVDRNFLVQSWSPYRIWTLTCARCQGMIVVTWIKGMCRIKYGGKLWWQT